MVTHLESLSHPPSFPNPDAVATYQLYQRARATECYLVPSLPDDVFPNPTGEKWRASQAVPFEPYMAVPEGKYDIVSRATLNHMDEGATPGVKYRLPPRVQPAPQPAYSAQLDVSTLDQRLGQLEQDARNTEGWINHHNSKAANWAPSSFTFFGCGLLVFCGCGALPVLGPLVGVSMMAVGSLYFGGKLAMYASGWWGARSKTRQLSDIRAEATDVQQLRAQALRQEAQHRFRQPTVIQEDSLIRVDRPLLEKVQINTPDAPFDVADKYMRKMTEYVWRGNADLIEALAVDSVVIESASGQPVQLSGEQQRDLHVDIAATLFLAQNRVASWTAMSEPGGQLRLDSGLTVHLGVRGQVAARAALPVVLKEFHAFQSPAESGYPHL
jgi:hypothetical protein